MRFFVVLVGVITGFGACGRRVLVDFRLASGVQFVDEFIDENIEQGRR